MTIRPTRILVWLVLAGAAGAFYWALQPRPQEADFSLAVRGPLQITLDERARRGSGIATWFRLHWPGGCCVSNMKPGDAVRAGSTVLAKFLPTDPNLLDTRSLAQAEARVNTAQATLDRAHVELDQALSERKHAESELQRHERLHLDGLLADDRLESARLRSDTAREAVRAAEKSISVAESELDTARASLIQAGEAVNPEGAIISLRSPVSGVVLRRLWESEAVVGAGEPLIEIADPEKLEIVSDMLSTDAVKINPNDKVLIERWGGDQTLRGRVRRVEPYGFTKISALGVEEQRVNVVIDFEDPREAWEALGDGYRVEVRVVIWEHDSVVKIPSSSLFRDGENWAVYTVDDMARAVQRTVEIGQRNAREAEILAGLPRRGPCDCLPGRPDHGRHRGCRTKAIDRPLNAGRSAPMGCEQTGGDLELRYTTAWTLGTGVSRSASSRRQKACCGCGEFQLIQRAARILVEEAGRFQILSSRAIQFRESHPCTSARAAC